ncbi:MAG TPA: ATP-binding protein [Ktedonobacteraceae bacterium]|nr:ATP-binding protein [Ktedonobacteraceae bacterium]
MAAETTSPKPGAARKRTRADQRPPAWANDLVIKYQSNIAHAFLLHGNVQDYVGGLAGQSLKNYLIESFSSRDLVICWDRASGFTLPTAPMRQRFIDIAGIPLPGSSSSTTATAGRSSGLASGLNRVVAATTGNDLAAILEKIRKPEDALDILSRVLHWRPPHKANGEEPGPFRVATILDYAESVAPATEAAASEIDRTTLVTLNSWGRDRAIGDREHIIVLIANELHDLNERLRRSSARWEPIEVPFPTLEERAAFINSLVAGDPEMRLAEGLSAQEMARLTTGLRYIDLEDILLRASFQQQAVDRALIKQRKDEIMRSEFADVLHIADVEAGFDSLGGLEEVKNDLRETVVTPMRAGEVRLVPQGILLMGPAGTGKTRLAKALAKESSVTFVELNLAKIFSKWVGDTERRLERALEAIIAWRPCIVFIDELDQSVGRGESGDSGVSNRVFKRLMEVMADTTLRGHVVWVGASNRPDLLDAALLRPGRLDKKIPILAPDAQERTEILTVLTRVAFAGSPDRDFPISEQYRSLAEPMIDYTGAEIEGIVGKAVQLRARNPQLSILQALQQAYERIIPTTQNIGLMTRLALLYCNDLDLVPAEHRELAKALRHPAARAELLEEQPEETEHSPRRPHRRDW